MKPSRSPTTPGSITEMQILPDGRVLVHNLTPLMAAILAGMNPADDQMRSRARGGSDADAPGAGAAATGEGPQD